MAHALQRLIIGDDPTAWSNAGFAVEGGAVTMGKVVVELVGSDGERGVLGWSLDGVVSEIDGLPTVILPEHVRPAPQEHPNMVFAIDHVVVQTNSFARTVPAFENAGMGERKVRTFSAADGQMQQSFFWAGRVIVEVVGPAVATDDAVGPAQFWGLALVSANLEVSATVLGDHLSEPKDAIQPGRKIATVRTRELDISVPIALMSPHVANLGEPVES